jgi:3-deoxy-D-manno-octulosonate 8-phosphate phosphatase (KDO 8-P phosphatase)
VDGVLTDGALYYSSAGEEMKAFNIQDGLGIKLLQSGGVTVAIITGRRSAMVERRAQELGITHISQGAQDKLAAFERLLAETGLRADQAACMGDDLPDLPLLRRCALGITVPDAPEAVRARAALVTQRPGGHGAVREVCELILAAQGTLGHALEPYDR